MPLYLLEPSQFFQVAQVLLVVLLQLVLGEAGVINLRDRWSERWPDVLRQCHCNNPQIRWTTVPLCILFGPYGNTKLPLRRFQFLVPVAAVIGRNRPSKYPLV